MSKAIQPETGLPYQTLPKQTESNTVQVTQLDQEVHEASDQKAVLQREDIDFSWMVS